MAIEGFTEYVKEDREKYNKRRWWLGMTWGDMFDKATDLYPEKIGLVDDVGRWTYSELRENVDRLAISLIKIGIKPHDRVFLQFPNWHEYIYAFFAMQKIGAVTALLIPRHKQLEINCLAKLTQPVAWLLPTNQYGKIEYQPIIDDVLKENPQIKHIIQVRTEGKTYPTIEKLIAEAELTKENFKTFGSSEGTNIATRPSDSIDIICNTVGRPVCPYDTIKIVDEDGNEVPANVEGELVSKGPGIITGYFKSPEENSHIFTKDGFFKTGDKARKDQFGNITITGRIKDIINRGGEKISAVDIENLMCNHPGIHETAVVGMPDPILGERICAYIVPKPSVNLTIEDILYFLKGKGASVHQLPERIELIEKLPLTKVGKVDKKVLREDIKKRLELLPFCREG